LRERRGRQGIFQHQEDYEVVYPGRHYLLCGERPELRCE